MKNRFLIFFLFLSAALFGQNPIDNVGACAFDGNPNLGSKATINMEFECPIVYDTTNFKVYKYVDTMAVGEKWVEVDGAKKGYKLFSFGAEKSAQIKGDTTGISVTFANSTWTIDVTNSTGLENVHLIGTDADYNSQERLYIEIIGGEGNYSYETIRFPVITKGDFSAKLFGDPTDANPYNLDVDNNPQGKIVEVGSIGNPKIKLRYDGMNAFQKYSFSIGSM